jgi:hypothetical protein
MTREEGVVLDEFHLTMAKSLPGRPEIMTGVLNGYESDIQACAAIRVSHFN